MAQLAADGQIGGTDAGVPVFSETRNDGLT